MGYKPQFVQKVDMIVGDAMASIKPDYMSDAETMEILNKLEINRLFNKNINNLSGGELQKLAIATTLMSGADLLVFDEPSANLDIEDRLQVMSIISAFVSSKRKGAIVVDHDITFLDSVCYKSILFSGEGGLRGMTDEIKDTGAAINEFLKMNDITMRRDPDTGRPRINQRGSRLDSEQRKNKTFFIS